MNYMDEVAEMLGVEPYGEFKVKGFDDDKFMLTPNGMFYYDKEDKKWQESLVLYDILKGTREIVKPILNKKEKKYLSDFIGPFKSQVTYIEKRYLKDFKGNEKEFISIGIKENEKYWRQMELPLYDAGKYYKGMNTSEHYTLEELNI